MFTLIIIRVGLGYTLNSSSGAQVSDRTHWHGGGCAGVTSLPGQDYPLRPVAINVSASRTHDRQSLEMYDRKDPVGDLESANSSTL